MRIAPTVGRVLWFFPKAGELLALSEQPMAATIAHVNEDGTLNITAHDHYGNTNPRQNVPLVGEGEDSMSALSSHCRWMPYQLGQAAKTEEALAMVPNAKDEQAPRGDPAPTA